MNIWLIMIGIGLGTFLIRLSFIALFGQREIPPLLRRSMRFIPASVLSALVVPQILTHEGAVDISVTNPFMIAGIIAGLVAWRTKNVLLTILSGMVVLWLLQWLVVGA
jgi:branched-subunit amino acid transport protein